MFGLQKKKEVILRESIVRLEGRCAELMGIRMDLEESVDELTVKNRTLTDKRQMEDEMIAHKLKMREEQVDINKQKEVSAVERAADKRVAKVKDEYRDKAETQLEKRGDELKGMFSEILTRLPDVNMEIKKDIKVKA